eukprot:1165656-Rhodomonas_salina.1
MAFNCHTMYRYQGTPGTRVPPGIPRGQTSIPGYPGTAAQRLVVPGYCKVGGVGAYPSTRCTRIRFSARDSCHKLTVRAFENGTGDPAKKGWGGAHGCPQTALLPETGPFYFSLTD